jgi:serine phosphatase RsbU (regulator of sigma subunit)/tetratricopeptide (TPR) repeat protein
MSKIIIALLLFHTIILAPFAQENKQDSLLRILDTITGIEDQMSFCVQTGESYLPDDWSQFKYWINKGIDIAKENEHPKIIDMYSTLSNKSVIFSKMEDAAEFILLGKTAINSETPVKYQYAILSSEVDYYLRVEQYEISKQKGFEIINMAEQNKDTIWYAGALHNLGLNFINEGDYKTGDSLISKAYELNKLINNSTYLLNNLSVLASIASEQGDFLQALEYDLIVQNHYDSIRDIEGMALIRINIAIVYFQLGQKELAYSTLNKGIEIAKENGFKKWEWRGYQNLSVFYSLDGNYEAALENYILFKSIKETVINEQSALKLNSLTEELNQKQLEILENRDALQAEKINVQDEKIKLQSAENNKKKILNYALIIGFLAVCIIIYFIYSKLKLTNKQNLIIQNQKIKVDLAYDKLEEKSKEITDSIIYAKRIQSAILPTDKVIKSHFSESFILYKPKDIVAGDFYWFNESNNSKMIAACDCTGHGVPGALVSVICNNSLNRAVKEFGLTDPGQILDKTRLLVIQEFSESEEDVKDGMDIALCSLDGNILSFAGANNPLWIIRNNEIIEIKGDKQPIGKSDNPKPYQTHKIELFPNDSFYIFTDGFADQFGGIKGKKLKTKGFKDLLLVVAGKPMQEQKDVIDLTFEEWKRSFEQLDDVCIIGVTV